MNYKATERYKFVKPETEGVPTQSIIHIHLSNVLYYKNTDAVVSFLSL